MSTEIVRDRAALTRLHGEWNALVSSSRADTMRTEAPRGAAEGAPCDD